MNQKAITPIKEVPEELRGLWKLQYQPLEKLLKEVIEEHNDKKNLEEYKKMSVGKKIMLLDETAAFLQSTN